MVVSHSGASVGVRISTSVLPKAIYPDLYQGQIVLVCNIFQPQTCCSETLQRAKGSEKTHMTLPWWNYL